MEGTVRFTPFEEGGMYGQLTIEHRWSHQDEPIVDVCHYLVLAKCRQDEYSDLIDQPARYHRDGRYSVYNPRTYQHLELRVSGAGNDPPIRKIEEPIKPPRAKQTRYQYGHWEKYTQAKGWEKVY